MIKKIPQSIIACALIALPAFTLTAMLTGCSSTAYQESTGQYIDSSVITTKVKTALLADKYIHALPITVKTFKNTVQLSGFVNTRQQELRAIRITQNVKGVDKVINSLVIKNP